MLDLQILDEMPDYHFRIINTTTGESVVGIINNDDFEFGTSAEYTTGATTDGAVGEMTKGVVTSGAGKVSSAASNLIRNNMNTIGTTTKSYVAGSDVSFSVSFTVFPNGKSGFSPIIKTLSKLTLPEGGDTYMNSSVIGSKQSNLSSLGRGGLIHVMIGDWFHATGCLCQNVNFNLSKYVNENKVPIYMNVTASFVSDRVMTSNDLHKWFRC